jgi:hypothetical protein
MSNESAHSKQTDPAQDDTPVVAEQDTITLDSPVMHGSQKLTEITLRKPSAGALRGLALTDVLQMDVTALTTLLPRITQPALTKADVQNMDPADLVQIGGRVANFLLPKAMREA